MFYDRPLTAHRSHTLRSSFLSFSGFHVFCYPSPPSRANSKIFRESPSLRFFRSCITVITSCRNFATLGPSGALSTKFWGDSRLQRRRRSSLDWGGWGRSLCNFFCQWPRPKRWNPGNSVVGKICPRRAAKRQKGTYAVDLRQMKNLPFLVVIFHIGMLMSWHKVLLKSLRY